MKDAYPIPAGFQETTVEIKRSQFITWIDCTPGVDAARTFIQNARTQFPDANHHCYAYIAGAPDDVYQIDKSDDGEPRDTAGKPMLNVLQHSGFGQISAVVIRYFGGVKLGAGGLVRAYSQCVSEAVAVLATTDFVRRTTLVIRFPYTLLGSVEHWLSSTSIDTLDKRFEADVTLTLAVPEAHRAATHQHLQTLGHGDMDLQWDIETPGGHT